MHHVRNLVASVLLGAAALSPIAFAGAVPAAAQQTGLVNVSVNGVNILNNVNIGVGLDAAADICGVNVGVLAQQLGRQGTAQCSSSSGPVSITQA